MRKKRTKRVLFLWFIAVLIAVTTGCEEDGNKNEEKSTKKSAFEAENKITEANGVVFLGKAVEETEVTNTEDVYWSGKTGITVKKVVYSRTLKGKKPHSYTAARLYDHKERLLAELVPENAHITFIADTGIVDYPDKDFYIFVTSENADRKYSADRKVLFESDSVFWVVEVEDRDTGSVAKPPIRLGASMGKVAGLFNRWVYSQSGRGTDLYAYIDFQLLDTEKTAGSDGSTLPYLIYFDLEKENSFKILEENPAKAVNQDAMGFYPPKILSDGKIETVKYSYALSEAEQSKINKQIEGTYRIDGEQGAAFVVIEGGKYTSYYASGTVEFEANLIMENSLPTYIVEKENEPVYYIEFAENSFKIIGMDGFTFIKD